MCMRPWSPNPLNKCHTLAHVLASFGAPRPSKFQGATVIPPCEVHGTPINHLSHPGSGVQREMSKHQSRCSSTSDVYGLGGATALWRVLLHNFYGAGSTLYKPPSHPEAEAGPHTRHWSYSVFSRPRSIFWVYLSCRRNRTKRFIDWK